MDFVDRLFNYLHQLINVVDTRCQAFFISPAKDAMLQSMRVIFFSCYKGYIYVKKKHFLALPRSSVFSSTNGCPILPALLRWEFIKENKKIRNQENTPSTKNAFKKK